MTKYRRYLWIVWTLPSTNSRPTNGGNRHQPNEVDYKTFGRVLYVEDQRKIQPLSFRNLLSVLLVFLIFLRPGDVVTLV